MLSILDTGMSAPTHSTLMPMNTSQQVWEVYSFTTWGSNSNSVLKEIPYDSCVYKEVNILFYILNKIVLTRYNPKKGP